MTDKRECKKCRKKFPATGEFFTKNARLPLGITHTCKPCWAAYMASWYARNHDKALSIARTWRAKNVQQARGVTRRGQRKLRDEFFAAYGAACVCCGERERLFLTVEHVGGGGSKDRKASGGTHMILLRLKKQGWPKQGFAVLCHNCQFGERMGGCPHRRKANV